MPNFVPTPNLLLRFQNVGIARVNVAFRGRMVKVFRRLGSSIEASHPVALDSALFGGAFLLPGRGRVGRFLNKLSDFASIN